MVSEREDILLIKNYVKPGSRVLDIGSNIGFYTEIFARCVGRSGKVHAFEPDALNFSRLQRGLAKYKDAVALNQVAVGPVSQLTQLYVSESLNVDHRCYDDGGTRKKQSVRMVAIDDYILDNEKIDFVKIDVQGYDFFALTGMKKLITRSPDLVVLGEFWPFGLAKAGASAKEYYDWLTNKGFTIKFLGEKTDKEYIFSQDKNQKFYVSFLARKGQSH